jgi:copper chaperone CopZ
MDKYLKRSPFGIFLILVVLARPASSRADTITYQITGLFAPERVPDLSAVVAKILQVKLIGIDFKNAEATFEYDPAKLFPDVKPQDRFQHFDNLLRNASNNTFAIKPLRTTPLDKLEWIEIGIVGLDCKACSLGAYEIIYKLDGVERATASFKEGRVTALIDPTKTNRARLEEALKNRGVELKKP